MNALWWNCLCGQKGKAGFGVESGSEQAGPSPFVQPGAPMSPSAFDYPPEYHAQLTPAVLSSSPIVVPDCGGSYAPPPWGWNVGWMVLIA